MIYFLIGTGLMIANVYFIDHYRPYYKVEEWLRYFSYPNMIFSGLLIFLGVGMFKQASQRYSREVEEQKRILEEKNREITDSINYAKKIQNALIPSEEEFSSHFREAFVFFKPKDIVSGDFYWAVKKQHKIFYATADCTGHGVPGGFMTMLGISFLDEIIIEKNTEDPAEILNALRERIIHTLKQTGTAGENKDGMDIVLCCYDTNSNTLNYAGANNSLYILRSGKMITFKPDKQPCGFHHELKPFTSIGIPLQKDDILYTFSDGYADQFGGPKGKKFKYKNLLEILLRNSGKNMNEQRKELERAFEEWKKPLEQIDDVLLIGIKV